jgi:YfiH family protein
VTTARQIHSDIVLVASGEPGNIGEGDALITNQSGSLLSIRTADCLPILIADPVRRVVAAVHAGWRGTVAGICQTAVARMSQQYACEAKDLAVAIGPGIGPCCFEVGPEVASRFAEALPERDDLHMRTRIDLIEVNQRYLERAGLSRKQISSAHLCTCCGGAAFESFRRDKEASGRMTAAIGIR